MNATASSLLKAAAKGKAASKSDHLHYDGDLAETAGRLLALTRRRDEIEREIGVLRDQVRGVVDPWYQETVRTAAYQATVKVPAGKEGTLRISYQHRYGKIPGEREESLRQVVGDNYDRYFAPAASVKLRKEVTDDPELLAQTVELLAAALGDDFARVFEAEQVIVPTRTFTERRWSDLTSEQNAALGLAGVYQIVAIAEGK